MGAFLSMNIGCQKDSEKETVFTPAEAPKPEDFKTDYIPKREKWGFINKKGQLVIEGKYEEAKNFKEGLAAVRLDKAWGFISKKGKLMIPNQYQEVNDFSDGLARVKPYGKPYAFINRKGRVILQDLQNAQNASEGYIAFQTNTKWGYYRTDGSMLKTAQFDHAESFKDGYARVQVDGLYGIIDTSGAYLIEPQYEKIHLPKDQRIRFKTNNKWGFLDLNSNVVIAPQFTNARDFNEGLAVVREYDEQYKLIDKSGKSTNKKTYSTLWYANEGKWIFESNGKFGLIQGDEKVLIDPLYDDIIPFSNERALVLSEGYYAYFDSQGQPITPFHFPLAWSFKEGLARVALISGIGMIDRQGQLAIKAEYADMSDSTEGLIRVKFYD